MVIDDLTYLASKVDELATLSRQAEIVTSQVEAIKKLLKETGLQEIDGTRARAVIRQSARTTTNWKALVVAKRIPQSTVDQFSDISVTTSLTLKPL